MTELHQIIDFIKEIEKLKTVKRQNKTLDDGRQENSAEHSWHLAMMAVVLGGYLKVSDSSLIKIIKMLLIHDLGEIYAGDTFLYDESARQAAVEKEKLAMNKLTSILPEDEKSKVNGLWQEFEEGNSEEAKIALALDALQPLLNHLLTAPKDFNPYGLKVSDIYDKKSIIKAYAPELWQIVEETISDSVLKGLYIEE